jgi:methionyl-tRNA synthetase
MEKKPFYITTTIPYVNSDPHIGFALEIVHADIFARYKNLTGFDVFFSTGSDEHGIKIYRNAIDQKMDPQAYVDKFAEKFRNLREPLGLFPDIQFIRTTDPRHKAAVQEFWKLCLKAGDIYKKNYQVKYCVGCELEKTDSELVDGKCPIHPNLTIEIIDEENYFFRFSKYQKPLLDLYAARPDFVVPDFRFNEIKAFVERGLEDFSISRLKSKMPWGVDVPDDPNQVMYVWFDAFVNYISTIGWPTDMKTFKYYWPVLQFAGKDQVRQQAAMWQAMLISAGVGAPSRGIVIHGFITSNGQKISKSLGNTIDPLAVVAEYGTDALRYYLARHIHPFEDSDFTVEKFREAYNANLANGLGNLVSRVVKMAQTNGVTLPAEKVNVAELVSLFSEHYEKYEFNKVCDEIWKKISAADKFVQENEPFKKVKVDAAAGKADISYLLGEVAGIGAMLAPILPETSVKIAAAVRDVSLAAPLFMRK